MTDNRRPPPAWRVQLDPDTPMVAQRRPYFPPPDPRPALARSFAEGALIVAGAAFVAVLIASIALGADGAAPTSDGNGGWLAAVLAVLGLIPALMRTWQAVQAANLARSEEDKAKAINQAVVAGMLAAKQGLQAAGKWDDTKGLIQSAATAAGVEPALNAIVHEVKRKTSGALQAVDANGDRPVPPSKEPPSPPRLG